jgi:hypothetical protein
MGESLPLSCESGATSTMEGPSLMLSLSATMMVMAGRTLWSGTIPQNEVGAHLPVRLRGW